MPVPAPFLVAEDDANDMFLFTRLLHAAGAPNALHIALDGAEAIRLLTSAVEKSAVVPRPAAAFLDTQLPGVDGLEVLRWIRGQRPLDALAVVMMSNQPSASEVLRATDYRAQCFLKKFPGKHTIVRVIEGAAQFTGHNGTALFDFPDNLLRTGVGKHPL